MSKRSPLRYCRTSPDIIRLAVMMHVRFSLSCRNVEDLVHQRGIEVTHATARFWPTNFGLIFAAEIRQNKQLALKSVLTRCITTAAS